MKIVLSPHGGSGNHGCEAIVRSSIKILNNDEFELLSNRPEEDSLSGLNKTCKISYPIKKINRLSFAYIKAKIDGGAGAIDRLAFAPLIKAMRSADLIMSIGGDNYCYGVNNHILLTNRTARDLDKKTVLWGCSIEQDAIDNKSVFEDLSNFTLITARESITFNALTKKGLKNVKLYPDPAFQLDRVDLPLPKGFSEGNTVGINVSPMIIEHEKKQGATLQNYIKLIEYIINNSDMQVVFIPHVVWEQNDDRKPLKQLFDHFSNTGRVIMIKDHNAMELKGYIARCRFFVAARTHASIAAYSEHVPTLVVGYSVKARGIARDIFGSEDKYVISVQSLDKENELTDAFKYITKNELAIKSKYDAIMHTYKARVLKLQNEIELL